MVFCWLPSHVGIKGNEKADIAAKLALTLNISDLKIPFSDFKPSKNTILHNKWQMPWNAAVVINWLVGCFGFNGPLRQYFSLYRAVSQRKAEREERIDESKNVQTTPPAPTASAIGPCPTLIKIVGRPGTGSLPSIIAPPDHPTVFNKLYSIKPPLGEWQPNYRIDRKEEVT